MLVKQIFTQLYDHSTTKQNPIWDLECDCQNHELLQQVEEHLQHELMLLFSTYKFSEYVVGIINHQFDEIIDWKRRSKLNEHKEVFSYIQFILGICAITQLNWDGEFVYCHDIFMRSLLDKAYTTGEEYHIEEILPYKFLKSKNVYIANSEDVIDQWFSQLYYYSKSFSGLNDWCRYFFQDIHYELHEHLEIQEHHPQFLSNLLSWCEVNFDSKGSNSIRNIIEREFNQISWTNNKEYNEVKHLLGLQLLLCNDYKKNEKFALYTELETNFDFNPLLKMQAIIAVCYDEENLIKNLDLLLSSIKEYNNYLKERNSDEFELTYQRARVFKNLLGTPIIIALNSGRSELITKILTAYYDIIDPQIDERTLFISPNQYKKVTYCSNGRTIVDEKDSQKILVEIIDVENKAFNTFRLLKGGVKQKIVPTNNPVGLPMLKMGAEYENKLLELYDFKVIENELKDFDSLCQFDYNSFPLQSLMIKTINKTLPINLSLSKKLAFTEVEKVLFWGGDSYTTPIEKEALKEIFENANIEFEVHSHENSSLSKFTTRIDEYNPDIIWISSHGEYKHFEPNTSSIRLSETESIKIRDFELLINNGDKRRLLFLNICEGGVHSQTGEFKNLGFPNLLTAPNQDVISHLWMAEARASYVFGVFLALGITQLKMNYYDAFEYSLSKVLSNKELIIAELESFNLELIELKERIQNDEGTEWGNIITTGSPVYNI